MNNRPKDTPKKADPASNAHPQAADSGQQSRGYATAGSTQTLVVHRQVDTGAPTLANTHPCQPLEKTTASSFKECRKLNFRKLSMCLAF